jgi:hypothetical protein
VADANSDRRAVGRFVVYGLVDPRDGSIRYVGRTGNLEGRLASHTSEGRRAVPHPHENPRKCEWLRELRRAGLTFGVVILERTRSGWEHCAAEEDWIRIGFQSGWPLTNRPQAAALTASTPEAA